MQLIGAGRDVMIKKGKPGDEVFFIVSELCSKGDLFEFTHLASGFDEKISAGIFSQVVAGVEAVHAKSRAHRDVKLENILLDKNCCPKLADFGMQKQFDEDKLLQTKIGTAFYMAPELYQ